MSLAVGSIYFAVTSCPHHGPSRSAPSSWYTSLWAVGWPPRPPRRHRIARLVGCTNSFSAQLHSCSLCLRWQSLPWTNGCSGPCWQCAWPGMRMPLASSRRNSSAAHEQRHIASSSGCTVSHSIGPGNSGPGNSGSSSPGTLPPGVSPSSPLGGSNKPCPRPIVVIELFLQLHKLSTIAFAKPFPKSC